MNFQDITYFLTLCGEKTFSAAADKLFITQQGLSKAIRRMENEIGAPLFERGRKTLALTPSGAFTPVCGIIWSVCAMNGTTFGLV